MIDSDVHGRDIKKKKSDVLLERMLLSLAVVPARHPKLADQFLPGTAASSLWSPEKEVPTMPKVVSAKPLGLTSPPSSEYWILAGG